MLMTKTQTMNEQEKAFSKIDTNDERISTLELQSLLRSLRSDASTKEVIRMMAEIDKDSDGYIDFHEFAGDGEDDLRRYSTRCSGISCITCPGMAVRIAQWISPVDADGDDHVNFDELRKMML
ncbi:hypothetical protein V2J09_009218 [Rumex salicifolius]